MGADPTNRTDWQPVDTTGASGKDIMAAVAVGRLWVKLMRINEHDTRFRDLVQSLYGEVEQRVPGLQVLWTRPLLLISSPRALVYYHADPHPTMLWQMRGSKRVWIYPADNHELLSQELLEQIFAGEVDEEAPYRPDFDQAARTFDLTPGEVLSWPLNAPHRVTNHDSINISLSVPYGTAESERRGQLYLANLYLRRRFGVARPGTSESGLGPLAKRALFRAARRLQLTGKYNTARQPYMAQLRIDGSSNNGVSQIPGGPALTPF
jgi:hypothetical protein